MACPFFMPMERLEGGAFAHPARLPLGGGFGGRCTAPGHEGAVADRQVLEEGCNLGYANCSRLPVAREWDAVRFAVRARRKAEHESDLSRQAVVHLNYVCEREHRPVEHGTLRFDGMDASCARPHPNECVQRMAECFLESYLTKKKSQPTDGATNIGEALRAGERGL